MNIEVITPDVQFTFHLLTPVAAFLLFKLIQWTRRD